MTDCVECGMPVADGDAFCSACGEPFDAVEAPDRLLTRGRLAALAVSSAVATGLILGSALGGPNPLALAAAALAQGGGAGTPVAAGPAAATPAAGGGGSGLAPLPGGSGGAAGHGATGAPQSSSGAGGGGSAAAAGSPASGSTPTPAPTTPPDGPSAPAAPNTAITPSKVKHVFLIVLASPGYDDSFGATTRMPYLSGDLRPRGALLTSYGAVSQSDLPNYIAMVSGQPPNPSTESDCATYSEFPTGTKVGTDGLVPGAGCVYPIDTLTLADQVGSGRMLWGAYAEDMGNGTPPVKSCRRPGPNAADPTQHGRSGDSYAARHNPFLYFHSLLDLGDCSTKDVSLDQLPAALRTVKTTPNFVFLAPSLCHDGSEDPCADGSPGGPAASDAFLAEWVPKILASPAYKRDGMLAITFAHPPLAGQPVGALVLSRWATPGATNASPYDHYSMLRSIEDLLGLQHLGKAAAPEARGFARDLLPGAF